MILTIISKVNGQTLYDYVRKEGERVAFTCSVPALYGGRDVRSLSWRFTSFDKPEPITSRSGHTWRGDNVSDVQYGIEIRKLSKNTDRNVVYTFTVENVRAVLNTGRYECISNMYDVYETFNLHVIVSYPLESACSFTKASFNLANNDDDEIGFAKGHQPLVVQ